MLAMILAGMALVGASIYVAQLMRLREAFMLDWRGTQIQGRAESVDGQRYRLRYELSTGIIAQTIKGKLPLYQRLSGDGKSVAIMYDPLNPTNFQARGQSYPATAIVGALFLGGMGIVLYARRTAMRAKRAARAPAPAPAGKGDRRGKKGKSA